LFKHFPDAKKSLTATQKSAPIIPYALLKKTEENASGPRAFSLPLLNKAF
jgi:hypothetical protein